MDRVASTMQAIEDIAAGRLAPDAAKRTIDEISRSPPSLTGLFALAAAAIYHLKGHGTNSLSREGRRETFEDFSRSAHLTTPISQA